MDRDNFGFVAGRRGSVGIRERGKRKRYVGFIDVIFSPFSDLTHSLLMNRPVGCLYLRPLGAVSSTSRSDILIVG